MNRLLSVFAALALAVAGCSFALAQSQNSSQKDGAAKQGKQGKGGQQDGQGGTSQAEAEAQAQAFQEIQSELDPDKQIQLVNDFEKKYPDSKGLPFAYLVAADAYRQKGEVERVVEYGEKSIKLKDDNPVALLLVASVLPEPQSLRGNDLDKEKKLSEAEEYANRAIKLIDQIPKAANLTDEQFQKSKSQLASWAHSSLGMVHLQRSTMGLTGSDPEELVKAEKEYQAAVTMTDRPNPGDFFRMAEAFRSEGKTDEAIEAFSKASQLDQGGGIKALADKAIEELKKKKTPEKPPAKP